MESTLDDHSRTIIHIDLDCFYAQVEMIKNPNLRNLPLGIQQKNIVVTSNYVAREFGVKKCMLITESKKLCPGLVLVKGEDLHDYRRMSYKVTGLLQKYSNLVERLGLDENFVDVTNLIKEKQNNGELSNEIVGHVFGDSSADKCDCGCSDRLRLGSKIAQDIRDMLKSELNLTSCAGIAHNKLLAKLVGAQNKPNKQTLLYSNNSMELMLNLNSVRNIPGIGNTLADQLNSIGINQVADLQNADLHKLKEVLGNEKSTTIYHYSYGIDKSLVKSSGRPQSIGIEDSCKSISVEAEIREKLRLLLYRLLILVQEDGRIPKTIKLTVRKFDKTSKKSSRESRQCNINCSVFPNNPTDSNKLSETAESKIMKIIMHLFSKSVDTSKQYHITLLGLSFTKFVNRLDNKNTVANFFHKDIEVQSITNIKNINSPVEIKKRFDIPSTSSAYDKADSDVEPEAKKYKFDKLNIRHCLGSDNEDCSSPSKLKVAELRLSPSEPAVNNLDDVNCPPDANEEVFRELPEDVQKELWEQYKRDRDRSKGYPGQVKKSRANSILNYFVRT